jgi:hypothetical protein
VSAAVYVALFGLLELLSNVLAAHYKFPVLGMLIPAGAAVVPLAMLLRDSLQEHHGRRAVVAALVLGISATLLTADLSVIRVALASVLAYVVSFGVDTYVFSILWNRPAHVRMRWSNVASLPIDTLIFVPVAFYGLFPILPLILGQLTVKLLGTEVAVFLYRMKDR